MSDISQRETSCRDQVLPLGSHATRGEASDWRGRACEHQCSDGMGMDRQSSYLCYSAKCLLRRSSLRLRRLEAFATKHELCWSALPKGFPTTGQPRASTDRTELMLVRTPRQCECTDSTLNAGA